MSLAPPRAMPSGERASVLLPSITCSSCGHPIPLSSLQEHICKPAASSSRPSAASGRRTPQPTTSKESERYPAPKSGRPDQRPSMKTNATYSHPPRTPLEAPRAEYHSSDRPPKSASPTNPFFPHPERTPSPKVGLGYGPVASAEQQRLQDQAAASQPDTTSGGGAGMAGVGRRAFAAAAWGVRMGVSLAATTKGDDRAPAINTANDLPPPTHTPNSASPHSAGSGGSQSQTYAQRPTQTPAEYAASLSQRTDRVEFPTASVKPAAHASQKSSSSAESVLSRSASSDAAKPSAIPAAAASSSKLPFFERYKQMASSSAGSGLRAASPSTSAGKSAKEELAPETDPLNESADEGAFDYDDDSDSEGEDGPRSALPWATPNPNEPVISLGSLGKRSSAKSARSKGSRTTGSISSSSSSSRSGRRMESTSGSEEVVTPSTSYEGLSEKAGPPLAAASLRPDGFGLGIDSDVLENIGEEGEDEEVIFAPSHQLRRSIDKPKRAASADDHGQAKASLPERSRTLPNGEKRRKTCQKCGDSVGGPRRFVERDGIVLCERDWKKLYLPSCRRCCQPIEKSAVSSSDGQLKGKWHRACFTCTRCDKPFAGDDFYVHAGKPWCQHHYHEENNSLCAASTCRQPIEGACILTAAPNPQRFHPGHLRCDHRGGASGAQSCRDSMVEYYDVAGGRYCERHVQDAMRKQRGSGTAKAEKRRTQLIDLR